MNRAIIAYGSVVWRPKSYQKTILGKFGRVQRLACIAVTGTMRKSQTVALETLMGLLPLDLFIKKTGALTALRMKTCGTWNVFGAAVGHRRILDLVNTEIRETLMPTDSMSKTVATIKRHNTLITNGQTRSA